jgi:hypothetical protein
MFCVPVLAFDGSEGVGTRFHVLRPRTHFGGSEGVGSRFEVWRSRIRFRRYGGRRVPFSAVRRASGIVYMFLALGLIFGGSDDVGSRFLVLCSRTRLVRCRGRLVTFSCFALPDSFSAFPRASGPAFMFCVPVLIFGGTEGVGSRFHVLCVRTHFRRYRGRQVPFSSFAL